MTPERIIWRCDHCGREFSREVTEVIKDEEDLVEVRVKFEAHDEESPLCDYCFGPEAETAEETAGE